MLNNVLNSTAHSIGVRNCVHLINSIGRLPEDGEFTCY
jgi:hypothetical protein